MIRFIHCVKKRDDVSIEDFRKFWDSPEFNNLTDRMLDLTLTADIKKNLTLDIDINTSLQLERHAKQPFDGVFEIIWQSGQDMSALESNPDFNELYAEMEDLQSQFVDFHESRRFITEYNED